MGSIPITRSKFLYSRAVAGSILGTRRATRSRIQLLKRPSPPISVQQLYIARDRIEAQLLRDYLDRRLIRAVVLRDSLSGAAGELPADIAPTLWLIDDEDLPRAQALIAEFLAPEPARADLDPWTCPSCGELVDGDFECCWNCCCARAE